MTRDEAEEIVMVVEVGFMGSQKVSMPTIELETEE